MSRHGRTPSQPTVEEALARARRHATRATAEGLEALRALLDAASLFASGVPAESHAVLGRAAAWSEGAALRFAAGDTDVAITRALADALDAEIARWEARAREDPEARAVLRAFLGVRELLWELGVRSEPEPEPRPSEEDTRRARPKGRKVERVTVQGG